MNRNQRLMHLVHLAHASFITVIFWLLSSFRFISFTNLTTYPDTSLTRESLDWQRKTKGTIKNPKDRKVIPDPIDDREFQELKESGKDGILLGITLNPKKCIVFPLSFFLFKLNVME